MDIKGNLSSSRMSLRSHNMILRNGKRLSSVSAKSNRLRKPNSCSMSISGKTIDDVKYRLKHDTGYARYIGKGAGAVRNAGAKFKDSTKELGSSILLGYVKQKSKGKLEEKSIKRLKCKDKHMLKREYRR